MFLLKINFILKNYNILIKYRVNTNYFKIMENHEKLVYLLLILVLIITLFPIKRKIIKTKIIILLL